jgi:hypothetical protein
MRKYFYVLSICLLFSGVAHFVVAQTAGVGDCLSSPEAKAKCEAELAKTEKEIVETTKVLNVQKTQSSSIQKDVNVLTSEIKQKQLNIKAKDINIKQIGGEITTKTKKIGELNGQIQRGQESLSQIIKKLNQIDEVTLPEIVFANASLSDALLDVDNFNSVNRSLEDLFASIRGTKTVAEKEKEALAKKKADELNAKQTIEANKRAVEKKEAEKKQLLAVSKTTEFTYEQLIAQKQKKAQQIRDALFALRDSGAIPFGTALQYAKEVQKITGVRPAFLLAIIKQESDLGKNVGSCLVTDLTTGDGKGKNTGTFFEKVMKSPRDTVPFQAITSALGRDWKSTPVSCPIGSKTYYVGRGFGSAMGPAQFIPSTWMIFENRIEKALGVKQADPWRAKDAFTASGMYLGDLGASAGTYSSEVAAACKYYGSGGATCTYGTQVMAKVANIQETMIDVLEDN